MKRYQSLGQIKVRPELFSPGAEMVNAKNQKRMKIHGVLGGHMARGTHWVRRSEASLCRGV